MKLPAPKYIVAHLGEFGFVQRVLGHNFVFTQRREDAFRFTLATARRVAERVNGIIERADKDDDDEQIT